jgi:hypothetical protein
MLGGGAVVPYVGSWSGEELRPTSVVNRPGGGVGYADETLLDRDEWGVLWTRIASRIGSGKPLFTKLHPVRQRRAMLRLLCQVCARPADRAEQGVLWVLPTDYVADGRGWPDDIRTIQPPLCTPCARLSIGLCPALRPDFVAVRAHSRVCGVTGVLFQAARRFPVISPLDNGDVIGFRDPAIAWVQAAQLARSLYGCTVVDLDRLDV